MSKVQGCLNADISIFCILVQSATYTFLPSHTHEQLVRWNRGGAFSVRRMKGTCIRYGLPRI